MNHPLPMPTAALITFIQGIPRIRNVLFFNFGILGMFFALNDLKLTAPSNKGIIISFHFFPALGAIKSPLSAIKYCDVTFRLQKDKRPEIFCIS